MTSRERSVGFEISRQQSKAIAGADSSAPRRTQVVVAVGDGMDLAVLSERARAVGHAYEILRTTFVRPVGAGRSLQVVHPDLPVVVDPRVDVASSAAFDDACRVAWSSPLDTDSGPTVRVTPICRQEDANYLVLTAATAVADDETLRMVVGMLLDTVSIDPDPLQYADYAAWQHEQEPVPTLDVVPTTLPQSAEIATGAPSIAEPGSSECADAALAALVAERAEVAGVATGDVWIAIWSMLVSRMSGTERVTIGLEESGRTGDEDLARAIGPLADVVPLEVVVPPTVSAADVARSVAESRELAVASDAGPVGSDTPPALVVSFRGDEIVRQVPDVSLVQFQLVTGDRGCELWWNPAIISDDHGTRVARALRGLVSSVVADGLDAPVVGLGGTAPGDEVRIDGPSRATTGPLVHRLVAERAREHPDRPALASGDMVMTYGQLDRRANGLAADLVARDIGPGTVVGVLMDRSIEQVLAILGVLTTGAAHLCLNADQPVARLAAQLDSAGARVVVASTAFQSLAHELVGGTGGEVVVVAIVGDERTEPPVVELDPADLAYVISTSGTSGTPKAVAVTHGGLRNYTEHIAGLIDGATGDAGPLSFGVVTSLSTDLANTCLYPALALGGCVHLVPHDDVMDPDRFAAYVARHPLDILKIAPSHLTALLAAGGGVLPSRILFTGGEVATWTLYQRVQELGTCRIFNHYGPSETTVGSLVFDVDGAQASDRTRPSVPIGLPLANTRVVLVDDRHRPVFPGAVGQIAIGGHGLARGYLGDPDRTRESFVDDPTDPGVRVYLTGDQGRRLPSGAVEFLGRLDGQVKVRGYRVETAEVEDALRLHPEVSRAAVIVREDRIDDQRLVAYVVSPYSHAPAPAELRAHLAERLPGYMVPSAFVAMSTLPLTANGKLDRSALPPPGLDDVDGQSEFIEPSTASEQMVAEIFADLLLVEQVGAEDDFFALGGHSLLATQAVARIRKATGVSLQVHQLFNEPTVRGLAGVVDTLLVTVDDADDAELRALLSELEDLTDEEAEALLAAESDGDAVT